MPPLLLPAGNASAWTGPTGNNTFLLVGAEPALVDAGVGDPDHVAALDAALAGVPLAAILLTHGHLDHASGLPALTARWPAARIVRFPLTTESILVHAGRVTLAAIHTPGHSPDHLSFFDAEGGDLFCGDLVRAGGTIVIPASRGGNLRQYLDSLRLVRTLRPRRLLPGHGPIVDDPIALIDQYLRHRHDRENQVVDALRAGLTTPWQIASRMYDGLAPGLMAAAADSVLAHLVKLQEEGRAEQDGDGWRLADAAGR